MKLGKWSVVAFALSVYCTTVSADESTFGFSSYESAAERELTPEQQANMQIEQLKRNRVAQNVTDKLYQKQVKDRQAYSKIEKDRSTLYVIEQMLRDKSTPKAERKRLVQQWRELKAKEAQHMDEFRAYQKQKQTELDQRAEDRTKRMNMDIESIREQAAQRALEEDQVTSSFFNYEKPKPVKKHYDTHFTFEGPTNGAMDAKINQQVNDIARKIQEKQQETLQQDENLKHGFFEEEEEERSLHKLSTSYNRTRCMKHSFISSLSNPVYSFAVSTVNEEEEEETAGEFDRIFSDEAYKVARENDAVQQQNTAQIKKPLRADTLAQAQQMFNGKEGLLLPNTPINMSPEKKKAIRSMIQQYINKQNLTKMKAYERDSLNTLIFNYGLQVLETGEVIALETIDNYGNGTPMIAPDVPVPDTAQQVFVGPEEAFKDFNYQETK